MADQSCDDEEDCKPCTCNVPGNSGMSFFGDKSLEFYRHTNTFIHRNMENNKSRIFQARLLNKPTVFVGCNKTVNELLTDNGGKFHLGYKDYFYEVFGDNILFTEGNDVQVIRKAMKSLFCAENILKYDSLIESICSKHVSDLIESNPACIYQYFKQMTLQITLTIFLDLDVDNDELTHTVTDLTTTHWHGLISLPLKVPGMLRGGYTKSLEAKERLLRLIRSRLDSCEEGFIRDIRNKDVFRSDCEAAENLLLFISALIPKALASLITSFILSRHRWLPEENDNDIADFTLEHILLEVMRVYPPFLGGRRVAAKSCNLGAFTIPRGMPIIYLTDAAHSDPKAFRDPKTFLPSRWKECNDAGDSLHELYTFGGGFRACVGTRLTMKILKCVCQKLYSHYTWDTSPYETLEYKWLPVMRPKQIPHIKFIPK